MGEAPQSLENHAKLVPGYHYVMSPLVFFPMLYFGYRAVTDFGLERLMLFIFSLGVFLATFYVRLFPLGVQDRVIRLEERLRMGRILPADLAARVPELTTRQLIALRFASDEELPELVRTVLDEKISSSKAIKSRIRNWRADHERI